MTRQVVTCSGPSREPHPETVVIAKYSCQYGCWVYDCPKCRYDVHVNEQRRPALAQLGDRVDLHRLAVTMADLRTERQSQMRPDQRTNNASRTTSRTPGYPAK